MANLCTLNMSRYALNADQNGTSAIKAQLGVFHHKPKFRGPSLLCMDHAQGWFHSFVKSVLQTPELVDFYKNECSVNLLIHQSRIADIIGYFLVCLWVLHSCCYKCGCTLRTDMVTAVWICEDSCLVPETSMYTIGLLNQSKVHVWGLFVS